MCPNLARQQDSIMATVNMDTDFDVTRELAAFRVAIAGAFQEAKMRCINKQEFEQEAEKLFNTANPEYKQAFEHVVPDDYMPEEPTGSGNDGGWTVDSQFDAIYTAANNAYTNWAKWKTVNFNYLFVFVFKQQGF
jgi:hypothetical protein